MFVFVFQQLEEVKKQYHDVKGKEKGPLHNVERNVKMTRGAEADDVQILSTTERKLEDAG